MVRVVSGKPKNELYSTFATLLDYPWEDLKGVTQHCIELLQSHPHYPREAVEEVGSFLNEISEMPLDDLQGIYSYTFEIASGEFAIDLGYHLYDGFKRANFLVSLKEMYKAHGFPYDSIAKGELPDHLTVLLRFLDFLKDESLKKELLESVLIKGVEKVNKNFELKNKESPYRHLIKALNLVIEADLKTELMLEKDSYNT